MKFRLKTIDAETGEVTSLIIDAIDPEDAIQSAYIADSNLLPGNVISCKPYEEPGRLIETIPETTFAEKMSRAVRRYYGAFYSQDHNEMKFWQNRINELKQKQNEN